MLLRRRRQDAPPVVREISSARAITAAATRVGGPESEDYATARKRKQEDWQAQTWIYLEEIPEVGRYGRYLANAFSRINLFVGIRPEPGADPIPLEPDGDAELGYTAAEAQTCIETLEALTSPEGGQSELQRRLGFQFAIPGECYLVGRPLREDSDEQRWDVYSIVELKEDPDRKRENSAGERVSSFALVEPGRTQGGTPLPVDTYVARLWRPHPQYSQWADSPLRSAGMILDELLTLTRAIQGAALSRSAGAGVLALPNSMRKGPMREIRSEADGQAVGDDPVVTDLLQVMATAVRDPGSAAAQVPVCVWLDDDLWRDFDKNKLVQWDRAVDEVAAKQRMELITRFASALDVPAEVLTGIGGVNHWGAWQIPEDAFRSDIEPTVIMADAALTQQYLVPALESLAVVDPERFVVWHDAGRLTSKPDRAKNAKDAHEAVVISDETYRRELGYSDDDAPEPDEVARRRAPQPGLPPANEDIMRGPPEEAAEVIEVFAAEPRLTEMSADLAAMDYALLLYTQQLCDAAMHRALERANARLRSLAQKVSAARAALDQVPAVSLMVAPTLGPAMVAQLADGEDLMGAAAFAALEQRYTGRVERVADEAILLAGKNGDLSDADAEQLRRDFADERDASWTLLLAALLATGSALLFRPVPLEEPGEVDGSLVPVGAIRGALARAGGGGSQASSMLTGQLVDRTLAQAKLATQGYVWRYGDASLRVHPFEPHRRLDGKQFTNVDAPVLANAAGAWPHVSHFWPGDHRGCACLVARTIIRAAPVRPAPRFL